ncbi:MAG TPA: hypothetical protein VKA19_03225 [Alphaproteobacteria bacterium]|nr:hypothetical protein [Alphaproteobacteria bacterium]
MEAKEIPAQKLAQDLRSLRDIFVGGSDDLQPWYAEANRISERLANNVYGFDEEELESITVTLFYYLGDGDLALKDKEYRIVWERWLEQFLTNLERPRRPRPLKYKTD